MPGGVHPDMRHGMRQCSLRSINDITVEQMCFLWLCAGGYVPGGVHQGMHQGMCQVCIKGTWASKRPLAIVLICAMICAKNFKLPSHVHKSAP